MKYELMHDILARKIEERVSAEEKYRRQVQQFIAQRYEFYKDTGEYLTQDALEYIHPHQHAVKISEAEAIYIKDSEQFHAKRRAKSRRRLRNLLIAAGVALLLITASLLATLKANQKVEQESVKASITSAKLFLEKYEFDSARYFLNVARSYSLDSKRKQQVDFILQSCNALEKDYAAFLKLERNASLLQEKIQYRGAILTLDSVNDLNIREDMKKRAEVKKSELDILRKERYDHFQDRRRVSRRLAVGSESSKLRSDFRDSVRMYDSLMHEYRPLEKHHE